MNLQGAWGTQPGPCGPPSRPCVALVLRKTHKGTKERPPLEKDKTCEGEKTQELRSRRGNGKAIQIPERSKERSF